MGRFSDDWVVDRSMFEYVNGGSCQCCGFSHMGMNMMQFMQACSDLETDDGKKEVDTPWPPFMREEIWADRVKLRKGMKNEMSSFKSRENEIEEMREFVHSLPLPDQRRLFQIPRDEISEIAKDRYDVRQAYLVVLCAVVEQVSNFKLTEYKLDGRGDEEVNYENVVDFDKRGGFTLTKGDGTEEIWSESVNTFFDFVPRLGGPKLMPRSKKEESKNEEDEEGEAKSQEEEVTGLRGQSFRADRRLIRLIIARYFAERIFARFDKHKNKDDNEGEITEGVQKLELSGLDKMNAEREERKNSS